MASEGTKLADAYVQIIPSAKGIKGKITEELGGEADSAGKSAGLSIASAIKGAIAAAGIGAALKAAITEGANLQQSIGGIETLFKDSADVVKARAQDAYKSAGMSANAYMETVTGFSASLLQGLAGDTGKAADIADMALTDMSDNANKMGTDMELIKNAYQGFAKQNYTMLDNLKLGYGGTKTEMQRLLADATKLSGVKYDLSNLSDVYEAIHVIQEDLNITGTTAKEAASTFSGSLAAMKAAGSNFLGNLTLGEDVGPSLQALGGTISTFLTGNLVPMTLNIITGLGKAIISTDWLSVANGIVTNLGQGIAMAAEKILGVDGSAVSQIFTSITDKLPGFADTITQTFHMMWTFCNDIWRQVGQPIIDFIMIAFTDMLESWDYISTLLKASFDLLWNVCSTVWNTIGRPIIDMIMASFGELMENWDRISTIIKRAFILLWEVCSTMWNTIGVPIFDAINSILGIVRDAFAERMPAIQEFVGTCFNDIQTFWNKNLKPCLEAIGNFIKNVLAPTFEVVFANFIGPMIDTVFSHIKNMWEYTLKPVFTGITDFLTGVFTLNVEKALEGLKSIFRGVVNGILTYVESFANGFINAVNSLLGGIAFLAEKAGSLLGFEINVSYLEPVSIPRLIKGGVLEKGQVGLLEGSGAEAVVPLENNSKWITKVARDMNVVAGDNEILQKILDILISLRDDMPEEFAAVMARMKFVLDGREFARLVKAVS